MLALHVHHELTEINEIRLRVLGVLPYLGLHLPLRGPLRLLVPLGLPVLVA
jgi:hypothetical protein